MPLLTSRLYSLSNKKSPHFFAVTTGSPRVSILKQSQAWIARYIDDFFLGPSGTSASPEILT
jgi:hypothetical protein